jgi:aspartyl protease family protein
MARHLIAAHLRGSGLLAALAFCAPAAATDVNVVGLFPNRAIVVVNGGAPRTLTVGQKTPEGVVLIAADSTGAVLEIDGKRQTLALGQPFVSKAEGGGPSKVTLAPDSAGHFVFSGSVNGLPVRFLVDTGATLVALPEADARRLGIDYRRGERGFSKTAAGITPVYKVKLESVTLGDITLLNVDGVVMDGPGLDIALLGMSFLNRTEMRREGSYLTLIKRY